MMDSSVQPSDSLVTGDVTGEGTSFEELKTSKLSTSKIRRVKRSRDKSAPFPKRPDFVLHGDKVSKQLPDYNGLKDEHLIGYFYNKKLRKILVKNGLISRGGKVVETKTCLNQTEVMKHTLNESGISFKSVKRGTLILGVQLPKLDPATAQENKKTKRRSSSVIRSDYHSFEGTSRAATPFNPVDQKDRLNMTDTKFNESSTQDNSFSMANTSLVDFYSAHVKSSSGQSTRRSSDRTMKKSSGRVAPTSILKDLKPMTKEDLKAAIERQKHKINETVIVDEAPELLSGHSSQRAIEEQQILKTEPSQTEPRNKPRPHKERPGSQETSKGFAKREKVVKRTESLSPSPLSQELPIKPYQEKRNIKIKTIRPVGKDSHKEKVSPLEKSIDRKPSTEYVKAVESPAQRLKSKGSPKSPIGRSHQFKDEVTIPERIEEGIQSPTQKEPQQVKKASYDTNRSPRREKENSARQSGVRPSSRAQESGVRPSSRAQEDKNSKRKETDPMNRDMVLVRQSTNDQDTLDQGQVAQTEPSGKSPRKDHVNAINRARTTRPSTSSNAQESRNASRKNTAGQEREVMAQSIQVRSSVDDSKKRVASAGCDPVKDEKKRFKMKMPSENPYDIPTQNGKGQKESISGSQSPSQKSIQETKIQEGMRSSKGQLQQSVSLKKEDKKLRTSASGNNHSPTHSKGKLSRTNTIEVKQVQMSKNTIEDVKTVSQSPEQGSPQVKEKSISDITCALFGSALDMVQPIDKSLLQRIKEAFRQRSLSPDPTSRNTSESPKKDNKNAQKA